MNKRYKLIIANKKIYKEISIPEESQTIDIGTVKGCDIRFSAESFFEPVHVKIETDGEKWFARCSDNLYISSDGILKLPNKELVHGDEILIKYQTSNQEVFKIGFMIDFDFEQKRFNRCIEIGQSSQIRIGGNIKNEIVLNDELVENDQVILLYKDGTYFLKDNQTRYGVYINGSRIQNQSVLHDTDFFSMVGYSFYLKNDKLYVPQEAKIIFNGLNYHDIQEGEGCLEYPKFNRSTRIQYLIPKDAIEILDPPSQPQKPKNSLVMSVLPAMGMLAITVGLRSVMGNGGSFVIISACTMGMGIVTSVMNFVNTKKEYKKSVKERHDNYLEYIEQKSVEIEHARREEREILEKIYFSQEKELKDIDTFSGDLFDRISEDRDFLNVRIGTGDMPAHRTINYKKKEQLGIGDELTNLPVEVSEKYRLNRNVPISCDFLNANAVGVIGSLEQLYEMMNLMVLDICTRQYQEDVRIGFIVSEEHSNLVVPYRLLPHVQNDRLNARNIICDDVSKGIMFEYLYKELSARETQKYKTPHFIIFVFDEMGIENHPISKYIETAADYGFTFVFFKEYKELLPKGCKYILSLEEGQQGILKITEDATQVYPFHYKEVGYEQIQSVSTKLAAIYCEDVSLESSLTRNISLFEMLRIVSADDLNLIQQWEESKVYKSMAAPLGVKTKNEPVYLNLHEKAHGPHGLVAGTTGSGKSEILQSYILSMASLFHPYDVGFMIIDFKGGGMVNQFKELPHLVGAITNIDGKEINRSLLSIKAELMKRQELFSQANVNHIDAYIKKYKAGECQYPLPHLIVIVDEFAELKAEQPEFMKELISAARIGRSLGVHLILATQKPSGQVNEQIWSNSKFKLCLKVQSKEDSNEVIKSPLAAEIKEPGRAYLQVGNNEIFELFQSAYSGAPVKSMESNAAAPYQIYQVDLSGRRTLKFEQRPQKGKEKQQTQLDALVEYISLVCKENKIERLPGICLPPLPDCIHYTKHKEPDSMKSKVALGIYDDPSHQSQRDYELDLLSGNTVIVGSSQYGKTALLQLIIRSVADTCSPDETAIYILDFGSMALQVFSTLNQVGGVVTASDDEKLKNLFRMLEKEMAYRKELFASIGITSFASYREAGNQDIPHIILIIDNFIALKELYQQYEDFVIRLCREGIALGISVVATSLQTNGLGYRYMNSFGNRVALYCNQKDEYSALFERCRIEPKEVPGRGLVVFEKEVYEYQTYLAFEGVKEIERVENMKAYISQISQLYGEQRAKQIPEIPAALTLEFIRQTGSNLDYIQNLYMAMDYATVEPVAFGLSSLFLLSVIGKDKDKKQQFLSTFLKEIESNIFERPAEIYLFDSMERDFKGYKEKPYIGMYSIDSEKMEEVLDQMEMELEGRYARVLDEGLEALQYEPYLIFIINSAQMLDKLAGSKECMGHFQMISKQYKNLKVLFLFADVENAAISYSAPELYKKIKEEKKAVILDNIEEQKVFDINTAAIRTISKRLEAQDAYFVKENEVARIKFAEGGK